MIKFFRGLLIGLILFSPNSIIAAAASVESLSEREESSIAFIAIEGAHAFQSRVREYLKILIKTETGLGLCEEINKSIGTQKLIVRETPGGRVCFSHTKGILSVEIDVSKIESSVIGCIGPAAELKIKKDRKGVYVFPIGSCKNPPAAVLGHELIHLLHYIKDSSPDKKSYKMDMESYNWKYWPEIAHRSAEHVLKTRFLDQFLWDGKSEEQYTVIGRPAAIGGSIALKFTENNIRKDLRLPPRYAYHTASNNFYECAHIVETILSASWGDGWAVKLRELHEKTREYNAYVFNPMDAIESNYTPYELMPEEEVNKIAAEAGAGGASGASGGVAGVAPAAAGAGAGR